MATFTNRSSMPTAVVERSTHNLSSQHLTTSNFFELNIAMYRELVPGQKLDVAHKLFSRLEPMALPTMGDAKFHCRAFFVPYRTIWQGWNDFINDTVHAWDDAESPSLIPRVPVIEMSDFITMFTDPEFSTDVSQGSNLDTWRQTDFSITDDDGGNVFYYNFTPLGRRAYKLFLQMGYRLDTTYNTKLRVSALPLLAFLKVYMDWYYPTQYNYDFRAIELEGLFYRNRYYSDFITSSILIDIFKLVTRVNYSSDGDIFVSAWDEPNAPNVGSVSPVSIRDINSGAFVSGQSTVQFDPSVTNGMESNSPVIRGGLDGNLGSLSSLSQYSLDALKALSDYMKRNQIAGARNIDRYLARFGIKLSSEVLRRSVYLSDYFQSVDFGDVTSLSDTEGASLGSYAGKGLSHNNNGFGQYVCDSNGEYGMFFVLTSIVPKTAYYQGMDRTVQHFTRLDFWSPEFDNLGTQAMGVSEVYLPQHVYKNYDTYDSTPEVDLDSKVFGFVPRYAEYKIARDNMTGDYVLNSKNVGKEGWTLFRNLDSYSSTGLDGIVHSVDFVESTDSQQYDRIFYNVSDNADKFNIAHFFRIKSSFPGSSLWDSYEFKNEEKSKKVEIENGGSKVN